MSIGRKRHPVDIQKNGWTQDPSTGEMVEGWATIGQQWASIDGISGREFNGAGAQQAVATHRITIDYRDDLAADMRFVSQGKAYDIKAILPNNQQTELTCMCEVGLLQ